MFFPCSSNDSRYFGVYFAPIDVVSEVDRIFSSLYFERTRIPNLAGSPEAAVAALRQQREEEIQNIKAVDEKINVLWEKEKGTALKVYSRLVEKAAYFGIRRYAARYNDNFILTGWIPADSEKEFSQSLDSLESVEYIFDGAEDELSHSPPVKLKNKKPFRPFEFFVDMYGLPSYDEIDPTPFVAITYIILFGIMFADLGQGILVSVIGYFMWRLKKMQLGKILVPCGVASAVFGLLFGSVFGFEHALDPFYINVLGMEGKPIEVMEAESTNLIIYAAVGIGLLLVMVAMLINIYSSLKRRHYENAFFGPNGLAGLIFYASVVLGFGGQLFLGWDIISVPFVLLLIVLPCSLFSSERFWAGLQNAGRIGGPKAGANSLFRIFLNALNFC